MSYTRNPRQIYAATDAYLRLFVTAFGTLLLIGACAALPYLAIWIYQSGDCGVERAVTAQAEGKFVLFGSGISQDFVDYKLRLYKAVKPDIIAIGSSRVMQFRGAWFRGRFLNMGGVAGNLAILRSTIQAMLALHKPDAVIIGIDFWWFMPEWERDPEAELAPTTGSYNYRLANLKKPLEWLLEGKISFTELGAPILGIFGRGFRTDRFGIMAQQTNSGFGPDGSWYYTAEVAGLSPPLDYKFRDTLASVKRGIRAFFHAGQETAPATTHIATFAKIIQELKRQGIKTWVFMPPLAGTVLSAMRSEDYPHLYQLRAALAEYGIEVDDFSDPAAIGADDCEFVDGFHGGEVVYARILRSMAERWSGLRSWVDMTKLDDAIAAFGGRAWVRDERIAPVRETDFLGLGCLK